MTLNVPNLDRLISYLEALPPEQFNMAHPCGTAACITGHCRVLFGLPAYSALGTRGAFPSTNYAVLITPPGYHDDADIPEARRRYPISRALRMLRHLRAEFLRTGTVVVDWDAPEAMETKRKPWAPPIVIGADKPLPAELTRLVREPATVTEA